jgi:hypothetical protein
VIDVGNVTEYEITGLDADTEYSIEVAAYDDSGNQSAWSAAVAMPTEAEPLSLLLDEVGVAAAGAWGLRKLRDGHAGAGVRVRRSTDNTELDVGFSGEDLDWADAIAFKGAGDLFLRRVYGQVLGIPDLVQAVNAGQPALDTVNQEMSFDGSDDFLMTESALDLSATDKISIVQVVKRNDNPFDQIFYEHSTDYNSNNAFIAYYSGGTVFFTQRDAGGDLNG